MKRLPGTRTTAAIRFQKEGAQAALRAEYMRPWSGGRGPGVEDRRVREFEFADSVERVRCVAAVPDRLDTRFLASFLVLRALTPDS